MSSYFIYVGLMFSGLPGVVRTRSTFVHDFHDRIPQGGFFFAGSLIYDLPQEDTPDVAAYDPEADLEADMAQIKESEREVARMEKVLEEARARAAKMEVVKQGKSYPISYRSTKITLLIYLIAGLAQRIIREQSNTQGAKPFKNMDDIPKSVPTQDNEEFLRTEYYKNFHRGLYHSKYFDAANKK